MEKGWDPEVKKYFAKILKTVSAGLIWLMAAAVAGLYYELGYGKGIYTVMFYCLFAGTAVLLLFFFKRVWEKK